MKKFGIFIPALFLGLGVLLISGMREQHSMLPREPIASIPSVMLGVSSHDVVVSDEEQAVAGMSDYVMRNFGPDSAIAFTVYVGYYDKQVQGKSIHSPKNCLPGAGFEIMASERVPLPGATQKGTINRVLLANKSARALVYYWYQGRGRVESNEYRVKWDLMRDAALRGRTEEALVRIVVPVSGDATKLANTFDDASVKAADALAQKVAAELSPAVRRTLPAWEGDTE